ncbi:divalent-cation tolerance protein CutA [Halovivax gelatinilyticus]|uniref:divalent-cation tolerance protein CutA n=1 Tax=Halovivax gelatinilyticus TaxID=2961597 RepID=UPI0020CA3421|nr:divalent-cation tolerance protein CutA [Halovivax gelatinilyticus]
MTTVYLTAPGDVADTLASGLVEGRFAACVNQIPCRSTYRWEGDVTTDDECVLIAKTTSERYDALVEYVSDAHPHDVPCIERFEETDGFDPYETWVRETVTGETDTD